MYAANGKTEKPETDAQSVFDVNTWRAEGIAWLIVVGLAGELVLVALSNRPLWEKFAQAVADLFIIGGVGGELYWERKARVAGNSIQADAKTAVAEAKAESDNATARAAEANARAANAELEAERLREQFGGRHITGEQARKIADAIRGKAASLDVLIEFQLSDPEAFSYGVEISTIFKLAGVEKRRVIGNAYLSGMVFGLWIAASPESEAASVAGMFKDAGIGLWMFEKDLSTHLPRNEQPPNLYIFVAPKLPVPSWGDIAEKAMKQQTSNGTRESNI